MNKIDTRNFKKNLMLHILTGILTKTVIFSVALILLFLLSFYIGGSFTWYGYEPLYIFLKTLANNRIYVFGIIWLVGFILICFRYWRKTIGYIEDMLEATNALVGADEALIHLPADLRQIEDQMNRIKYESLKNERAAKDAEQRKNDLVVYLAHDLKTPLTSVIGYLTLLHDERQISGELREKYLAISLDKAQRLEELINEFFDITRFNLSNLTLELSRINLTRMLEQIIFEFKPVLSQKQLTCILKAENDIMIKCDVNKLERVFDNLLRNAINYSYEGSEIVITAVQDKSGVFLEFFNHGSTIPEQKLNHIFEQFFRLDSARTSSTGGAGLGLAIAKEIVELHKGKIEAFSKNEMIEIKIFLPLL